MRKQILSIMLIITMLLASISNINITKTSADDNLWTYNYTGEVESFTAPQTGTYYLEIYGASGGNQDSFAGGLGGYSSGYYNLYAGETIYLTIGGQGTMSTEEQIALGGYNGGGDASNGTGSGGGATSITTTNRGTLSNFEEYKNEIILVAGGGGGQGTYKYDGSISGSGGGLAGTGSPSQVGEGSLGGNQTSGYAFGIGQNSNENLTTSSIKDCSGYGGAAGGGYYGGTQGIAPYDGGGGGSGYIGNIENGNSSIGINRGDGYAIIRFIENKNYTLYLSLGSGATYNGNGEVEITGTAGTTVNINIDLLNNYTLKNFEIVSGSGSFDGTNFTFGFGNTHAKTHYAATLLIDSSYENGNINLTISQDDDIDKLYNIQESLDGNTWSDIVTEDVESTNIDTTTIFSYTGGVQSYTAPMDGIYYLEAIGAAGGNVQYKYFQYNMSFIQTAYIAKGGKTSGYIYLNKGDTIYIVVGSKGGDGIWSTYSNVGGAGGYNGGGNGGATINRNSGFSTGAGGGGATSITTTNRGILANFKNYKSEIILVAGGGGASGGGSTGTNASAGSVGGAGGGAAGGNGSSGAAGGTQTSGYAFGKGQDAPTRNSYHEGIRGGGGGYYGGYSPANAGASTNAASAGGGSGYTGGVLNSYPITSIQGGGSEENGSATISISKQMINTSTSHSLKASDNAKPNAPSNLIATELDTTIQFNWTDNGDNGTSYFHRVISYNKSTLEQISMSNPIENVITSGINGFYYVFDTNTDTIVTTTNGTFTTDKTLIFEKPNSTSYLHLAAIDNAGNISDTYTLGIRGTTTYNVNHKLENLDGTYETTSETYIAKVGDTVTPNTNAYDGFTTPVRQTVTVEENGITTVDYIYTRKQYEVTYIDVLNTIDGTVLAQTKEMKLYGEVADGFDIGNEVIPNAYYPNYILSSSTSETVDKNGIIVYRIFNELIEDKVINIIWQDAGNENFRPESVVLNLYQNKKKINSVELQSDNINYTFSNLPNYDSENKKIEYTYELILKNDRYTYEVDLETNTIISKFQDSTFSVTIPKTIVLDEETGEYTYDVEVKANLYYNDYVYVVPEKAFRLTDEIDLIKLDGTVTQEKTTFKSSEEKTTGLVKVNMRAGKYYGSFSFDIGLIKQD